MIAAAVRLDEAVLRILGARGAPVGAGFLVADGLAVTCAHVVAQAGGTEGDGAVVSVDFPLLAPGVMLRAEVDQPAPASAGQQWDIAWLRLIDSPPSSARPAKLVTPAVGGKNRITAFGYPAAHDDGVRAFGRLAGPQASGWIQLDAERGHGHFIGPGFSGGPAWDEDLGGAAGMVVAADPPSLRTAYVIPTELLVAARPDLLMTSEPACPYRGLSPFTEADQALFYGQEEFATDLTNELRSRDLLVITGPSGAGKSSLALAGVLPRLRRPELAVVVFRPGGEAVLSLATALLPLLEPGLGEVERLARAPQLAEILGQRRLPEITERVIAVQGADRLLIVADQLEEAFTEGAGRQGILLAETLLPLPSRVRLLATLRADFIDHASRIQSLADALRDSLRVVGPMDQRALASVIIGPLPRGVTLESGLAERIRGDLGDAPGRLPLLQFTLTQLWEHREHGRLTHAAYDRLGEVGGSLAVYAENVWVNQLKDSGVEPDSPGRSMMTQLVHPGEDTASTRRIVRRADLTHDQWSLAQKLADHRLLVIDRAPNGDETIELAHETLITHWDRLHEWTERDRDFRTWQDALQHDLKRWEGNAGPRALLYGAALTEARRWRMERSSSISKREHVFIATSLRHRLRARLQRSGLTFLVAAIVTGLALLGVDTFTHDRPGAAARLNQLAAKADTDPVTSLLYSIAAYRTDPDALEATGNLFQAYIPISLVDQMFTVPRDAGDITHLAASEDGRVLAATTYSGKAFTWRLGAHSEKLSGPVEALPGQGVDTLALSGDGEWLAVAGNDRLWIINMSSHARRSLVLKGSGRAISAIRIQGDRVAVSLTGEQAERRGASIEVYTVQGVFVRSIPIKAVKGYATLRGLDPDARSAVVAIKSGSSVIGAPTEIGLASAGFPRWRRSAAGSFVEMQADMAGNRVVQCRGIGSRIPSTSFRLTSWDSRFPQNGRSVDLDGTCGDLFRLDRSGRWLLTSDDTGRWTIADLEESLAGGHRVWAGAPSNAGTVPGMVTSRRISDATVVSGAGTPRVLSSDGKSLFMAHPRPWPLPYPPGTVGGATQSPDGRYYVVCGMVKGVVLYAIERGEPVGQAKLPDGEECSSGGGTGSRIPMFSSNGKWLAVVGEFDTLRYLTPRLQYSGKLPGADGIVSGADLPVGFIGHRQILIQRNSKLISSRSASDAGRLVFDLSSIGFLDGANAIVSADASMIAVMSPNRAVVQIWNARKRKRQGAVRANGAFYTTFAMAPDGNTLAVGDDSGSVWIHDLSSAGIRFVGSFPLKGNSRTPGTEAGSAVDEIVFINGGRRILAGSSGLKAFLDRTEEGWVVSAPFAGARISEVIAATRESDRGIGAWKDFQLLTRPEEWIAHICSVIGHRELTDRETRDLPEDAQVADLCGPSGSG